jgi:hypothetical protein
LYFDAILSFSGNMAAKTSDVASHTKAIGILFYPFGQHTADWKIIPPAGHVCFDFGAYAFSHVIESRLSSLHHGKTKHEILLSLK